jgi:hypothetical protein
VNAAVGRLLVQAWSHHATDPANTVYDETLHEVAARVAQRECLSKADIGSLVLWKRITAQATWATRLQLISDVDVRRVTHTAYLHANDPALSTPAAGQAARNALWDLPGMGGTGSLSSALLLAMAPDRMAVWDRRVAQALTALGSHPDRGVNFYSRYLSTALALAEQMSAVVADHIFAPRDVDVALYVIAGSPDLLHAARRASAAHSAVT